MTAAPVAAAPPLETGGEDVLGVLGEEEGKKKKKKEKRGKKEKSGKKKQKEEVTQTTTSAPQAGLLDLQLGTPAPQVYTLFSPFFLALPVQLVHEPVN